MRPTETGSGIEAAGEHVAKVGRIACPECGAPLPEGGGCIDIFHAMLLLEWEVTSAPGAPSDGRGGIAHFYAVSSYLLQHPEGMGYTAEALAGARQGLADHLAGRVTLAQLRPKVRRAADGATRITRRAGDRIVRWPVGSWPMNVAEVVAGDVAGYIERVTAWAESVIRTLDEARA